MKIPLDAEFDGEQIHDYVPTPGSNGNDEKIASKVWVVFSAQ
jgi:hypothetical protein